MVDWLCPPDMAVEVVMRLHPATIRVFLDRGMACVGCPIGRFHTVADVARIYGMEEEKLIRLLSEAAGRSPR